MIVIDASALLEWLLRTPTGMRVDERLSRPDVTLHAPHLIDLEAVQVIRRYRAAGDLDDHRARLALDALADLPLTRYPHAELIPRIWELRRNLTAYDAAYVALAEALAAPVLTCDAKMSAPGVRTRVEVI
jgi:predicted nucleic acid-binding protein